MFFSFHYQEDIWRANVVRNAHIVQGTAAVGFHDASLWERAKRRGAPAVTRMIDKGLVRTTVTVVLIGAHTAGHQFVDYEINASMARGNGLLGIHIDRIRDHRGQVTRRGRPPRTLARLRVPCYVWNPARFADWVEAAAIAAGHSPQT